MSEKFIPGIYNYCDRWCERCAFTGKCRTFAMDIEERGEGNPEDPAIFWDKMAQNLQDALEMLQEKAAELGIDLDNIPEEELMAQEELEQNIKRSADEHIIMIKAIEYAALVEKWLKESEDLIAEWQEKLIDYYKIGLDERQSLEEIKSVSDAVEVIQYYQYFIQIKLKRAISGKLEEEFTEQNKAENDYPKDYDGSAKVALIAIGKSMGAWHHLMEEFEEKQDEILDYLALLSVIKNRTESYFPDAKKFIRPGFDEI